MQLLPPQDAYLYGITMAIFWTIYREIYSYHNFITIIIIITAQEIYCKIDPIVS